ncbi:MAG: sigma-70 family RNA polymerase sigma factor [Steroidobacteraceae bacterium]|nr:sigma-70 family RNA polymerase sigma factor [Steroidobacteraceae bacterium]
MEQGADRPVTQLLAKWRGGNEAALGELTALIYQELRALAQRHLRRERPNHTIQRTALVHEAFVRLINQQSVDWQSRAHFFALASNLMRRILVDHARARLAEKRGGGAAVVSLDEIISPLDAEDAGAPGSAHVPEPQHIDGETDDDVAAIDTALTRLASLDERQARIVEMRYFGGLTIEETAEVLGISDATVKREWTLARAWLRRELAHGA